MAVIRIAMIGLGSDEPTASAGGRHTDLAAKLIALMRFAFADAFHTRFMHTVDLVLVLSLLIEDTRPDIQQ